MPRKPKPTQPKPRKPKSTQPQPKCPKCDVAQQIMANCLRNETKLRLKNTDLRLENTDLCLKNTSLQTENDKLRKEKAEDAFMISTLFPSNHMLSALAAVQRKQLLNSVGECEM